MDEELRQRILARARELWERDGRPASGENAYLAAAEAELAGSHSAAGEEDPLAGVDQTPAGAQPRR